MKKENVVECNKCKNEFFLSAVEINEAKIVLNNTPVILVYFSCPKCNEIYRISIQDARYYDLKADLDKTKEKIRKIHGSGNEELARVLNNMVNKKLRRLKTHVETVNKMFPGTFVFVPSENNSKEKNIKYLP